MNTRSQGSWGHLRVCSPRREGDTGCVQVTLQAKWWVEVGGQEAGAGSGRAKAEHLEVRVRQRMDDRKRGLGFEYKLMETGFSAFLHPMNYGRQICVLTEICCVR